MCLLHHSQQNQSSCHRDAEVVVPYKNFRFRKFLPIHSSLLPIHYYILLCVKDGETCVKSVVTDGNAGEMAQNLPYLPFSALASCTQVPRRAENGAPCLFPEWHKKRASVTKCFVADALYILLCVKDGELCVISHHLKYLISPTAGLSSE